ncbi:MAG: YlxR family protein [Fimbriimonadaceae bacterium]|nr:YlxR family protein [Fimbriimonadaceae bacterium]
MIASPVRTCIACRAKFPQASLLRFQVDERGELKIATKTKTGRSFYICPTEDCLNRADSRSASRVMKKQITTNALSQVVQTALCQHR